LRDPLASEHGRFLVAVGPVGLEVWLAPIIFE